MNETSLFAEALEIKSELERAAFLKRACGDDEQLQQRIEELLRAHGQSDAILDATAELTKTSSFPPISEKAGSQIGPYRLMEQIGEGGFGVVFVAEQQTPVRRKVALKLIKPGMDSRQVVARFEAERQALAMMDHPNIARVLDAGATETGRPYFVMELVRGISITEYCDKNHLNPRERMEIFVDVCNAIQHAHQKGIIHRDIKPSNVLVTSHDGKPVAKVIDFGVAKAIYQQLTERTIYTQFAQMIGTPLYMSPEQAEMSGLDIDTRTDIYALGVLLYELFTGSTPLEHSRLVSAAYDEVRRMIREDEPPLPSQRISTSATLPSLAANRNTEPARLSYEMKGELDWIVMKALEKDRTRRYETASAFAADIGRYLRDEQVEACPPSAKYRLDKFLRRNRVAVLSGSLVTAALLVGIIASGAFALISRQDRNRLLLSSNAERALKEKADQLRQDADKKRSDIEHQNTEIASLNISLQRQQDSLRHTLYASEMNLVQAAAESGQYARAAQLLDQQRPELNQFDYRGFEWNYWHRKLQHGRLRSVEVPQLATRYIGWNGTRSFSRNAARLAALVDYPDDLSLGSGPGLLAIVDGVTGRELLAPFDPFPDEKDIGNRRRRLMAMSDDGTRLAVALARRFFVSDARSGRISIRDGDTGQEIRRIEIPGLVCEIALSADGSRLAVEYVEQGEPAVSFQTSGQAGVMIWDTSTGELVRTLPMLPWTAPDTFAGGNKILWSPDGARLLRQSVLNESTEERQSYRERLQVVEAASGEKLWESEFPGVTTTHRAWSWSPDGKMLVIFENDESSIVGKHTVQLWDSDTGTTLAILDRTAAPMRINSNIAFSPDGRRLAIVLGGHEIFVWEVPKLQLAAGVSPVRVTAPHLTLHNGKEIIGLAFSADGRELQGLDAGTSIVTWNATARDDSGFGPDAMEGSSNAKISADVTKVAFSKVLPDPVFRVWDLVTNRELFQLKSAGTPDSFCFSPDGRCAALVWNAQSPQQQSQIVIHDALTGEKLKTIQVDSPDSSIPSIIVAPVFRPDGAQIAALSIPPRLQVGRQGVTRLMAWDASIGKQMFSVDINAAENDAPDYSHDGTSLIMATNDRPQSTAVFYDASTGERQRSIPLPSSGRSYFADAPNEIFGSYNRSDPDAVFGDLATGKELLRLPGYNGASCFAVSPDGSRLVLGKISYSSNESELTLWSLKSGTRLLALNRRGYVSDVSFSPDGNRLVAAFSRSGPGPLKPIQIWDATPLPEQP